MDSRETHTIKKFWSTITSVSRTVVKAWRTYKEITVLVRMITNEYRYMVRFFQINDLS